jgi:Lon-like ATP-dependent protease
LADFAASIVTFAESKELQEVLEEMDINVRLQKTLLLLKKEVDNLRLQHSIDAQVSGTR